MSKVTQREMQFEVLPTAADDATVRGAALAESVLEDIRIGHDWEALRERLALAAWKGGTAAICVDWDPNAGSPITDQTAFVASERPEPGEAEEEGERYYKRWDAYFRHHPPNYEANNYSNNSLELPD